MGAFRGDPRIHPCCVQRMLARASAPPLALPSPGRQSSRRANERPDRKTSNCIDAIGTERQRLACQFPPLPLGSRLHCVKGNLLRLLAGRGRRQVAERLTQSVTGERCQERHSLPSTLANSSPSITRWISAITCSPTRRGFGARL